MRKIVFTMLKRIFQLIILFLSTEIGYCQSSKLIGMVTDAVSNNPLPYATISILNQKTNTYGDDNGIFRLVNITDEDSIKVTFVGYESRTIQIKDFLRNFKNFEDPIKLPLQPLLIELSGIEIRPVNADTILNTALQKILASYNQAYCSQVSFRGTQLVNNSFTQWIEGYGEALFLPVSQQETQKGKAFFKFEYARAAGWELPGRLRYGHFTFVQNNFIYALPWKVSFYSSKVVYASTDIVTSNQIVKVQLTPKASENKALQKIDKQYGFGINEPSLFEGVQRTYWINLSDTTITSIELFSKQPAMASLDNNKRNYYYRRYYFEVNTEEGIQGLSKAFSTLRYSLPKQKGSMEHSYEFHFSQNRPFPEDEDAYRKEFGINKRTTASGFKRWEQDENNIEYPKQYFNIPMKTDRSNKPPTKILSPFIYQIKALKDLADAPGILLFQEIP